MCHDVFMGKRSSRMAKRDEFENGLKAAEEAIGLLGKNPAPMEKAEKEKDDNASAEKPGNKGNA
jgi:hypothetical protein